MGGPLQWDVVHRCAREVQGRRGDEGHYLHRRDRRRRGGGGRGVDQREQTVEQEADGGLHLRSECAARKANGPRGSHHHGRKGRRKEQDGRTRRRGGRGGSLALAVGKDHARRDEEGWTRLMMPSVCCAHSLIVDDASLLAAFFHFDPSIFITLK